MNSVFAVLDSRAKAVPCPILFQQLVVKKMHRMQIHPRRFFATVLALGFLQTRGDLQISTEQPRMTLQCSSSLYLEGRAGPIAKGDSEKGRYLIQVLEK